MGTATEFKHPADDIARALARANGILTVLSGCYDKSSEDFAIATTYLAESIAAVDGLLASATTALGRLYQICDLTVIREANLEIPSTTAVEIEPLVEIELPATSSNPSPITPSVSARGISQAKPVKPSYLAAFGPTEDAASLAERVQAAVPDVAPTVAVKRNTILSKPATTYDELLAKVTAVADEAAFEARGSNAQRSLLPALEGLRADLLKMRAVA